MGTIVCITGMPAAGKSSVGRILAKRGFKVYELGDIVREMMSQMGIAVTPESDKKFTIWMRKRYGNLVTVKRLSKEVNLKKARRVAIVGLRSKPEIDYLRRYGSVTIIAVVAPLKQRYYRVVKRGRPDAPRSVAEFERRDKKEEGWGLLAAIRSADFMIAGTGNFRQLEKSVGEALLQMKDAKAF
ncbi:MAG: AAA family ATPase [Candidatus Micrarchaeota archaeon]|nr:AAA family ATPase [Candidatus Micrarchaeota archaeon]